MTRDALWDALLEGKSHAKRDAIFSNEDRLLAAGPGSGKTWVLVHRYLRLLSEGADPERMLAITFTRKAASEMRSRIRDKIQEWMLLPEEAKHLPFWFNHFEALDRYPISTLHAFCASVLRRCPLEAGVDPDFVLEGEETLAAGVSRREDLFFETDGVEETMSEVLFETGWRRGRLLEALGELDVRPFEALQWAGCSHFESRAEAALAALFKSRWKNRMQGAQRSSVLSFNQLEELTVRLMNKHPRIVSYDHVLVDEFQDTNTMQWELIQGLKPRKGTLFLVGDEKQSIYRFRGADPSVFYRVKNQWQPRVRSMDENFRSLPKVIDAVNALGRAFFRHAKQEGDGPVAQDIHAKRDSKEFEGSVGLCELSKDFSAYEAAQAEAGWIAVTIQKLLQEKESADAEPYGLGQMAILLRSKTHREAFEQALEARGLAYRSVWQGAFASANPVCDIKNLLRAIVCPEDNLSLASALRSPLFSVSDEGLLRLSLEACACWAEKLQSCRLTKFSDDDRNSLARAQHCFAEWKRIWDSMPFPVFLEKILDESGAWTIYAEAGSSEETDALKDMLDFAMQARESGVNSLAAFIEALDSAQDSPPAWEPSATGDAISLLSVHRAKGLEFRVVFVAGIGQGEGRHNPPLVLKGQSGGIPQVTLYPSGWRTPETKAKRDRSQDKEEEKRILYVAASRARDRVYFSGHEKVKFFADVEEALSKLPHLERCKAPEIEASEVEFLDFDPMVLAAEIKAGASPAQETADESVEREEWTVTALAAKLADPATAFSDSKKGEGDAARSTALEKGNFFHQLMEDEVFEIESSEQRDDELKRRISLLTEKALQKDVQKDSLEFIEKFKSSGYLKTFKDAKKLWREREFLISLDIEGKTVRLRGKIDALFEENGTWRIVDYKTGGEKDLPAGHEYEYQMKLYALAVRQITGAKDVRAELMFIPEAKKQVVETGEAALDELRVKLKEIL